VKKGSIGIFSLLVMMLVANLLFALLEATRCQEIRRLTDLQTQLALESAFANYDSMLWEEYGLLGCDINQLENRVFGWANCKADASLQGLNLLKFGVQGLETQGYTLLTDGTGAVYEQVVASRMQRTLAYGMAQELFNQYEVMKWVEKESSWSPNWLANGLAQELVENAVDNPMKEALGMQNKGILELVVENTTLLSSKGLNIGDLVSHRTLKMGKSPKIPENDWLDKVLLQQYILENMSNYCKQRENRSMNYEVEYVIGGKGSDIENLKYVVNRLLFLREMTNFLYLTSSPLKMKEAGVLALALAGASVNPVVVEVVKMGIVAAWVLGESVLDVRALLQGKKIPLLKSESTWTLEISQMANVAKGYLTAKESESGLSYQQYLGILLLFLQDNELSMHTMDMQEAVLRMKNGNSSFRMDEMLVETRMKVEYLTVPVFLTFYQLEAAFPDIYRIKTEQAYSYY